MSKFVITKEHGAAKPFFAQHMEMLIDRYCDEVPEDATRKILSINLVKDDEGDKERMLSEYYENLLTATEPDFAENNKQIGYRNFPWHAATKNGTQPFVDLLNSLDDEYLKGFGIYHETRNAFTKEGQVI